MVFQDIIVAAEGNSAVLTVERKFGNMGDTYIRVAEIPSGSAVFGSDFVNTTSFMLHFADRDNTNQFVIMEISADVFPEIQEVANFKIDSIDSFNSIGSVDIDETADLTSLVITSNGNVSGVFTFDLTSTPAAAVDEGSEITLIIDRSTDQGSARGRVQISWEVDFLGKQFGVYPEQGVVTFDDGEARKDFQVWILEDQIPELAHVIAFQLVDAVVLDDATLLGQAVIGETNTVSIAITSSDYPNGIIQFVQTDISAKEPDFGVRQIDIEVERSFGNQGRITVLWSIDEDHVDEFAGATSGSLVFEAGSSTSQIISIPLAADTEVEFDTTAVVSLTFQSLTLTTLPQVNVMNASRSTLNILLAASDFPLGSFRFNHSISVPEPLSSEDYAEVSISIVREGGADVIPADSIITVFWNWDDPIEIISNPNNNFIESVPAGSTTDRTVEFTTAMRVATVTILVVADQCPEQTKMYGMSLTAVSVQGSHSDGDYARINDSYRFSSITIPANDYPQGYFTIGEPQPAETEAQVVLEGDSLRLSVVRSTAIPGCTTMCCKQGGTDGNVTIQWRLSCVTPGCEDALHNNTFSNTSGLLVFAEGVVQQDVLVTVVHDSVPVEATSYQIVISVVNVAGDEPGTGTADVGDASGYLFVVPENDYPYGLFSLEKNVITVVESNVTRQVVAVVTRTFGSLGPVTLDYSIEGVVVNGDGYAAPNSKEDISGWNHDVSYTGRTAYSQIEFRNQQTSASVELTILEDQKAELDEVFQVELIQAFPAAVNSSGNVSLFRVAHTGSALGRIRFASNSPVSVAEGFATEIVLVRDSILGSPTVRV